MHFTTLIAFLCLGFSIAAGQTPVEFSLTLPNVVSSGHAFAANVVGTNHPEILNTALGPTLRIIDQHAPSGTTITNFPCVPDPIYVQVADVDQDGDQDILVLSKTAVTTSDTLSVFFQNGALFTRVDTTISGDWENFDVGDFDGDSDPDVLFGSKIYLNDSFGGYPSSIAIPFTFIIGQSRFGDFDGDGDLDVLGYAQGPTASVAATVQIMRHDSGGGWTPRTPINPPGAWINVKIGDMNGDGRDDACMMIINQYSKVRVRSYLGQASAGLSAQTSFECCGTLNIDSEIEIGDIDGDGDQDVAMSGGIPYACTSQSTAQEVFLALLANDGNGHFEPMPGVGVAEISLPTLFGEISLIDEDLDGDLDIIGTTRGPFFYPGVTISTAHSIATTPVTDIIAAATPTIYTTPLQDVEFEFSLDVPSGPARGHFASLALSGNAASTNYYSEHGVADVFGNAGFTIAAGAIPGYVEATATTANGSSASTTIVVNPSIAIVSGGGQTSCVATPFAQPLVALVTAGGNPVPNADVTFTSTVPIGSIGVAFSSSTVKTNAAGFASVTMTGSPAGVTSTVKATAGPVSAQTSATTLPTIVLAAASGNGQAAVRGTGFAQPLTVQTNGCQAPTPVGAPVTFQVVTTTTSAVLSSTTVLTDSSGRASVNVTAGPVSGPLVVSATFAGQSINFNLTITSTYLVTSEGGHHQATGAGVPFPHPLEVRVVDASAQPVSGLSVAFSVIEGSTMTTLATPVAVTDSQGRASTIVIAGAGIQGPLKVRASVSPEEYADFDLVIRRLSVTVSPNGLTFLYRHDNPGVPLIFAVDTPLPAPGYITTPFGNISTSILSPGPGFVALDGFGIFGSIDPGMVTAASNLWIRSFALPPMTIGATFVAEIYGYDFEYADDGGYFVSNPVTFSF